jgi:hypothetical protein
MIELIIHTYIFSHSSDGNMKAMQVQLFCIPLDDQIEREIVTYCSSTNPSTSNLNFLFAFYLNRYDYASAMDLHQRLHKQDMASLAQQQRKVMIDSVSELIPSIQRKICKVRSDYLGSVQCKELYVTLSHYANISKPVPGLQPRHSQRLYSRKYQSHRIMKQTRV